jgi:hypothetical protein
MRTGIHSTEINEALKSFKLMLKEGRRHQNYRSLKNVVRGLRRRRNWLMHNGQWPRKQLTRDFSYSVEPRKLMDVAREVWLPKPKRMVGKSFVPNFDYPETKPLRLTKP